MSGDEKGLMPLSARLSDRKWGPFTKAKLAASPNRTHRLTLSCSLAKGDITEEETDVRFDSTVFYSVY